MSKIRGVQDKY